tara:strand:+ start:479 stop:658 length:180 start_codon:yes stop_codon:yes gene_type:complete
MIKIIPKKIVAVDSMEIFTLEKIDDFSALIDFIAPVTLENWQDIQKAVSDAMKVIFPEE